MTPQDYINTYYFENIADRLKPDYDGMLFQFNENKLINVTFKSKIDNNIYRVRYHYDEFNHLLAEHLRLVKANTQSIISTKNVITYWYRYKNESIDVTSYGNYAVADGIKYIKNNFKNKVMLKIYDLNRLLRKSIDIDLSTGKLVMSKYDYDMRDRISCMIYIDDPDKYDGTIDLSIVGKSKKYLYDNKDNIIKIISK